MRHDVTMREGSRRDHHVLELHGRSEVADLRRDGGSWKLVGRHHPYCSMAGVKLASDIEHLLRTWQGCYPTLSTFIGISYSRGALPMAP